MLIIEGEGLGVPLLKLQQLLETAELRVCPHVRGDKELYSSQQQAQIPFKSVHLGLLKGKMDQCLK